MNSHTFHQWITRKYGFFTQHRRKYPTLVHLRFPQRKISLARYLLIKHEHITIFPQLRTRVYSFNHHFYLKFDLFFPQYHLHPAIQILPFQARVNTRFTPTNVRKCPSYVGARPDFMFARIIGKTRIADHYLYSSSTSLRLTDRYAYHCIAVKKDLYHREDSHYSYYQKVQTGHEHEVVQLFHRFYRLQSTAFPGSLPGPFTGGGYQLARREEARKRRNEETEKRRREVEGFPKLLEPGSIYRSLIMSRNISHVADPGKEAFHMVRRTFLGSPRRGVARMGLLRLVTLCAMQWGPSLQQFLERRHSDLFFFTRNRYDSNTTAVTTEKSLARIVKSPTHFFEPRRHAKGREEEKKRRNEETQKRRREEFRRSGSQRAAGQRRKEEDKTRGREVEGFPERLEPGSIYRSMIMSKNISHLVDPGKEAFQMARMRLLRLPTQWGQSMIMSKKISYVVDPGKEAFNMVRRTLIGSSRYAPRRGVDSDSGKEAVFSSLRYSLSAFRHAQAGTTPLLQELSERRHSDLFIFTRNRYDSNTTAVTTEKSLTRMVKIPTYFFEPRRHAKGREEEKKRRNEETEKGRVKGEGFPWRLESGSIYRSMIMSKNISHLVDPGKEAFHTVRRTFLGSSRYAPRRGVAGMFSKFITAHLHYPTYEKAIPGNGGKPGKRRNGETEKRRREAEGFPKRLERESLYKSMIMSKMVSHVVDPGKEAFHMARMGLFEKFSGGPGGGFSKEPPGRRRHMEPGGPKMNRHAPALDYFIPHRVSVGDRDQSLIDVGKPVVPGMDVKDKITGGNIFDNHASPGISQQQGPNIDIDQLTDRVYRVLEDKIRMEKEMRGW